MSSTSRRPLEPGTESEIKLRVASPDEARARLARLPAQLVRARHFEDNLLYDDVKGSLRAAGRLLRLRRAGEQALLTFKGPAALALGVKTRAETEVAVADPEALGRILAELSLSPVFRYQKYRETYRDGDAEIVIDETPIGTFLEIEAAPAEIHRVAAALGYARSDYLVESYAALFFAGGGTGDMVFQR